MTKQATVVKTAAAPATASQAVKFNKAQRTAIYALALVLVPAATKKPESEAGKAHALNVENENFAHDLVTKKLSTPASKDRQHTSDRLTAEALNKSTKLTDLELKALCKLVAVKAPLLIRAKQTPNVALGRNYVAMSMLRICNGH